MTALLYTLLQITVGSALTAAAILLVRLIFHRWLSAKAKYYLWLLLALRLCLPVLPGSPFSVLNWIPQPGIVLAEDSESARPAVNPSVGAIYAEENMPSEPGFQAMVSPSDAEAVPAQNAPAGNPLSHNDVIFLIWLVGVGITLSAQVVLYIITGIKLRRLPLCDDTETLHCFHAAKRSLGYHGSAKLVRGAQGMSGGLFRPVIVIPAEVCGEAAAPILIHELKHIQSGDLWLLAFYRLLCGMHWFNPISWLSFRQLKRDCEAANDQRVLESGLVTPVDYATTLFAEGIAGMVYGTTHFGGSDHDIRNRIRKISAFKKPAVWMAVLAVILGILVCACTLTGTVEESTADHLETENTYAQFQQFIIGCQPPNGRFGLTIEEHVAEGLLSTEEGTLTQYEMDDTGFSYTLFETTIELGGYPVSISYDFSQTALSEDEILTQVFVKVPKASESFDSDDWFDEISDAWEDAVPKAENDSDYRWRTEACVGAYLTEQQLETVADALVNLRQRATGDALLELPTTADEAYFALNRNWRIVSNFYDPEGGYFQYNGTGAALIVASNRENARPAGKNSKSGSLAEVMKKYDTGIGVFGDSFEETVAAGYLAPESCVVTEQTEISTVYETEVELLGETTEATYVFSVTQFTESEDGRQVLTEIHVRIPTSRSGDKTAWIQEIGTWHNDMYGGAAVDFYASPETVSDFLTETQQEFVRKRLLESDMAENEAAAEEYLQNWELALYYVQYDELIFNGTGLALCRTSQT